MRIMTISFGASQEELRAALQQQHNLKTAAKKAEASQLPS